MMQSFQTEELPENPRDSANIFTKFCLCDTFAIFFKGRKKTLTQEDLYQTLKEDTSETLGNALCKSWQQELEKKKPSLLLATIRVFGWQLVSLALLLFMLELVLRSSQPIFLNSLISYFSNGDVSLKHAYFYAAVMLLFSGLQVILLQPYKLGTMHLGMKIRLALCSMIYRKALRLSKPSMGQCTAGEVMNLISNDVARLDAVMLNLHYIWMAPLQTILVTYLMYREIGIAALFGIALLIIFIPFQIWLGKKTSEFRLRTALRTDERVRIMSEVIAGIQVIKAYAWELAFGKQVANARKKEMRSIRRSSYIRGVFSSFVVFLARSAIFCCLLGYVLMKKILTAEKAFVTTAFINMLRLSMTLSFPLGISQLAEALVSVRRIEKFMLYDETSVRDKSYDDMGKDNYGHTIPSVIFGENEDLVTEKCTVTKRAADSDNDIVIDKLNVKWDKKSQEYALNNIHLRVKSGSLVAIIGAVGSGKSSLIQSILGELQPESGRVVVRGTTSYASQEPWLFTGTVQQNILHGAEMNRQRYSSVIQKCALERDLELLPNGDKTIVGERGASLSGGQKARISLARAVYRDTSIYLLDDPLSAVDTDVGQHLFEQCIRDFLREKTVVLVTNQMQLLQHVDQIVFMEKGSVNFAGSYSLLGKIGLNFAKLQTDKNVGGTEEKNKRSNEISSESNKMKIAVKRKTSICSVKSKTGSTGKEELQTESTDGQYKEYQEKGEIDWLIYRKYFKAGGGFIKFSLLILLCILMQLLASGGDFFLSYWVANNSTIGSIYSNTTYGGIRVNDVINMTTTSPLPFIEDTTTLNTNKETQSEYISTISPPPFKEDNTRTNAKKGKILDYIPRESPPPFQPADRVRYEFLRNLGFDKISDGMLDIYIFTIINIATILITLGRSFFFFNVAMRASINLHKAMFRGITRACMFFFHTNPLGRILNRFSKDMGQVDEVLPFVLIDAIQTYLAVIGMIVNISIVNPYLLLPIIILGVILYYLRNFYLKTSSDLKRLEGIARSPIYSHMSATLKGLPLIRALGTQRQLVQEFDNYQDLHSSSYFMFLLTARAFGYWQDCLCFIYVALVTLSFFVFAPNNGGEVGLAITQALGMTGTVNWAIRQSAEVENTMTSVERIVEYQNIEPEGDLGSQPDKKPPPEWPEQGKIVFKDLSLRYNPNPKSDKILKELNLVIKPREKVGIVGRTGAGKSSLINALFRLSYNEGSVIIDGRDTKDLGLHDLRSNISIIPQEPVLFSGTMRYNLDPFGKYSDELLWQSLDDVKLKALISELPSGLDTKISEGGNNFSVGQRQLVCLARAILRNNRILVMDEATANVDPQTDKLIQATIRKKFKNCTVLTIAHRLETIIDSHKVLVMDAGSAVEFDESHELLRRDGEFYRMARQSDAATFNSLLEQAQRASLANANDYPTESADNF